MLSNKVHPQNQNLFLVANIQLIVIIYELRLEGSKCLVFVSPPID